MPLFVSEWLDDPVRGPSGRLINFRGFAIGDGFPACIPMAGKPIDWCVDLKYVEFFKYPNALPGPYWDVEFFHGHSQMSEALYHRITTKGGCTEEELKGLGSGKVDLNKADMTNFGQPKAEDAAAKRTTDVFVVLLIVFPIALLVVGALVFGPPALFTFAK